ncbi:hypothetical protein QAD02_011290 [Eretmocerus hayati]|uniref:Uncharacterized protein n=1 Tax=Eretmocerus hayati TaxID=131215 RepID=A0ACC2NW56_9HYME|nr:hypothetical protein QAD02_011290 [Eretmocerus hayati]
MSIINVREAAKKLYYFKKPSRWDKGIGAELPEAYKKFWKEWKLTEPTPVHYQPLDFKYKLAHDGATVVPVQNTPIPLKYPKELDDGIWGGEAVVQGFIKKQIRRRRVPKFFVPKLFETVVHSEILDKYMKTVVTRRTFTLIHEHLGFDHYILSTKACDLRSLLALKLKREMLIRLFDNTLYPDDPDKQSEIASIYIKYTNTCGYTREELDWYGLSYKEACSKYLRLKHASITPTPLKVTYRKELLDSLQKEKGGEGGTNSSWISKINPFGKSTSDKIEA